MMRTLQRLLKQDRERYKVPRKVQDVIPIKRIWNDGIFLVGGKYTKSYKFTEQIIKHIFVNNNNY